MSEEEFIVPPEEAMRALFGSKDPTQEDMLADMRTSMMWWTNNLMRNKLLGKPEESLDHAMIRFQIQYNEEVLQWMRMMMNAVISLNNKLRSCTDWNKATKLSLEYTEFSNAHPIPEFNMFRMMERDDLYGWKEK